MATKGKKSEASKINDGDEVRVNNQLTKQFGGLPAIVKSSRKLPDGQVVYIVEINRPPLRMTVREEEIERL